MLAAYSSALVCVYATYRIGLERGWRWGVVHLVILVGFLVAFYGLESYAAARTPFFSYPKPPLPQSFPDWIPFLQFPGISPPAFTCENLSGVSPNLGIPFSVLLLEATLVFAAGHTARLLADYNRELLFRLLRPFMAALALLAFDFFLDPLGSSSLTCTTFGGPSFSGLGFWEWYVMPSLGPDAFGVPLFNYVLWFCAPVILVALIGLLGWFYDYFLVPLVVTTTTVQLKVLWEGAFLSLIVFAFSLIYAMSPNFGGLPINILRAIFIAILLTVLISILYYARFFNYRNDFRWWFVFPQAVFLLVCLLALFFAGVMKLNLLLIALVVTVIFVVWMLSPYWKKIFP